MQNQNSICELAFALSTGLFRYLGPTRLALFVGDGHAVFSYDPTTLCDRSICTADIVQSCLDDRAEWPCAGQLAVIDRSTTGISLLWAVERSPALLNINPITLWLEYASDVIRTVERKPSLSQREMFAHREAIASFGTAAIKSATELETRDFRRIHPIDVILSLSLAYEEGKKCSGNIAFVQSERDRNDHLAMEFGVESRPLLHSAKHLRKYLTSVERSPYWLVSDAERVIGVSRAIDGIEAAGRAFPRSVVAQFTGGRAEIWCGGSYLCSAFEGQLMSRRATPQKEAVLGAVKANTPSKQSPVWEEMVNAVWPLIAFIYKESAGCSLVLDIAEVTKRISGEYIEDPLALDEEANAVIASRMAKIDGALHIGRPGLLLGFACLLDGARVEGEDRSRGARFNSAVRFTAAHKDKIVLTVSSDGPISCFHGGKNILRQSFSIEPGAAFTLLS